MIPTRIHGYIDYLTGAVLILAPWLFGFANDGAAMWTPILIGASIVVYSLLTRYELGAAKLIPMPAHLALDIGGGIILAVSPWLFGFADLVWWPHVLVGVAEIAIAAMTSRHPESVVA